jgi:hypothetical protein
LGREWTADVDAGVQQWLRDNPQNKHGKHRYSLEDWGFSKKALEPYFSDYLRVHPVAKTGA